MKIFWNKYTDIFAIYARRILATKKRTSFIEDALAYYEENWDDVYRDVKVYERIKDIESLDPPEVEMKTTMYKTEIPGTPNERANKLIKATLLYASVTDPGYIKSLYTNIR